MPLSVVYWVPQRHGIPIAAGDSRHPHRIWIVRRMAADHISVARIVPSHGVKNPIRAAAMLAPRSASPPCMTPRTVASSSRNQYRPRLVIEASPGPRIAIHTVKCSRHEMTQITSARPNQTNVSESVPWRSRPCSCAQERALVAVVFAICGFDPVRVVEWRVVGPRIADADRSRSSNDRFALLTCPA